MSSLTVEQIEEIVSRNCEWYEGGEIDAEAIFNELNAVLKDNKFYNYKKIIEGKNTRIEELLRNNKSLRNACKIGDEIIETLQLDNKQKDERIKQLENLVRDAYWLIERAAWPTKSVSEAATDWYIRLHNIGIEVEQ